MYISPLKTKSCIIIIILILILILILAESSRGGTNGEVLMAVQAEWRVLGALLLHGALATATTSEVSTMSRERRGRISLRDAPVQAPGGICLLPR